MRKGRKKIKNKITNQDADFMEELFYIALQDLNSAQVLFKKNKFSQAVYLLQQSLEKITKVIYLIRGNISFEDLKGKKGIGHNSFRALFIGINRFLKKRAEEKGDDVDQINIRYKERSKLLDNKFDRIWDINIKSSKERILAVTNAKRIQERFDKKGLNLITAEAFNDKRRKNKLNDKILWPEIELFQLGVILSCHEKTTRYPSNLIKFKDYNKDLGIIQAFPDLVKKVENIIIVAGIMIELKTGKELKS